MRSIATLAAALALSGCAAAGVKVTEEQAQAFKVGSSTYPEVVAALGNPTSNSLSSNGVRTAVYTYSSARAQAQNFIPYVGPLVAGYDRQASTVVFTFDPGGTLTGMTSSQSGVGAGANLAAGANAAGAPYQQPR